ncbi:MAG: hypothetical protein K5745_04260 [Saccharofermentans sp.]|nr:hypothetical protein [Saccharofermentans sp.]
MRKVFIINARSNLKSLALFNKGLGAFDKSHLEDCEFKYTAHAGHASEIALDAVKTAGFDGGICDTLVVACGGDGTVHEVANVLAETGVPMAVIPMGTGNDFARSIMDEQHRQSSEYCVSEILTGDIEIRGTDLIKVESFDGEGKLIEDSSAWCNNVASIGLDTDVQFAAKNKVLKHPESNFVRKTAYITSALGALFGNRASDFAYRAIRGDGKDFDSEKKRYTLISICNGGFYGNGFNPAPDANVSDGLINVCAVDDVSLLKAIDLIIKYKDGKHYGNKNFDIFTTTAVTVTATGGKDLRGNYDGEDFTGRKCEFTVVKDALKLAFYK